MYTLFARIIGLKKKFMGEFSPFFSNVQRSPGSIRVSFALSKFDAVVTPRVVSTSTFAAAAANFSAGVKDPPPGKSPIVSVFRDTC